MVHEKKKSGDPDFDDKVPAADHLTVVTAGDGKIVGRLDPALGPVTPEGSHLPMVDPEELDTRPAPGEVAEYKADVQTYSAEDTPHEEVAQSSLDEPAATTSGLDAIRDARNGTESAGNSGDQVAGDQAPAPAPAKKTAAGKTTAAK
jgi:hypothetical protein